MNKVSITYTPRPDATPEAELDALSNVYRQILNCHAKRNAAELAAELDDSNDVRKGKDAHTAAPRVPQE